MAELAGLPLEGPATLEGAKASMSIEDDDDNDRLEALVDAVNTLVRSWRCSQPAVGLEAWPANLVEGATMLTVRLFRRKNSPAGVEAMGEAGPVYVMRSDPDVAMLLGLGAWAKPAVG